MARYICLLVSDDDKLEIKEESRRGLTFPEVKAVTDVTVTPEDLERTALPSFETFPAFILQHALSQPKRVTTARPFGSFTQKSFSNVLIFVRRLLIFTANPEAERAALNRTFDDEEMTVLDLQTRQSLKTWMEVHADLLPPYIELLDLAFSSQKTGSFESL